MIIIQVISINRYILAVYYTSFDCFKYSIVDDYETVYEPDDIFHPSEARKATINIVSSYWMSRSSVSTLNPLTS